MPWGQFAQLLDWGVRVRSRVGRRVKVSEPLSNMVQGAVPPAELVFRNCTGERHVRFGKLGRVARPKPRLRHRVNMLPKTGRDDRTSHGARFGACQEIVHDIKLAFYVANVGYSGSSGSVRPYAYGFVNPIPSSALSG